MMYEISWSPFATLRNAKTYLWSYFVTFSRTHVLAVLETGVVKGRLEIVDSIGVHNVGEASDDAKVVKLNVIDDNFWARVMLSSDLGFSEAYMCGEVEVQSIKDVLALWIENRSALSGLSTLAYRVSAATSALANAFLGQTVSRARLNAIAGYDCSNALFQAFLSEEMMYSCALWGPEEGGPRGDLLPGPTHNDLENAQRRKIHYVLKKARIRPGDRILEFGSGWGAMAIEAVRSFGAGRVDTITLSIEQKTLADERIAAAGLSERITVHLIDYRQLPPSFEKAFDAFISIEMIEHVGTTYYNIYFKIVDWALKNDRAVAIVSSSTRPETRYTTYQATDFGRRYIWPNGSLPSATALITAAHSASLGRLTLESVEDHGPHYARTLREWGRRLQANLKGTTLTSVLKDQPLLAEGDNLSVFKRKWMYLFGYAEAGFATAYTTCHMLTFVREANVSVDCA